jgi:hypothetical protein
MPIFITLVETGKEDETSQVFEQFFGEIEDKFAKEYDGIVDAILELPTTNRPAARYSGVVYGVTYGLEARICEGR